MPSRGWRLRRVCHCQAFPTACHCQTSSMCQSLCQTSSRCQSFGQASAQEQPQTHSFSCTLRHKKERSPCHVRVLCFPGLALGPRFGPSLGLSSGPVSLPKLGQRFGRPVFSPATAPFLVRFWSVSARRAAVFHRFEGFALGPRFWCLPRPVLCSCGLSPWPCQSIAC